MNEQLIHTTGRRMTTLGLVTVALAACSFGEVSRETEGATDDVAYRAAAAAEVRPDAGTSAAPLNGARAILRDANGMEVGVATLEQYRGSVRVNVSVQGLPPGKHGFHVHQVGRCDPPTFESAGEHFAPLGHEHGIENPDGPHAGDLPNLHVMSDGRGENDTLNPWLSLDPQSEAYVLRPGGTSIVVHAGADDYYTAPSGNSGARIACGVVEPA